MAVDKLTPNDPRVQHKTAKLNGRTYGYLLGEPKVTRRGTIFLLHGFPDLSFGWRYQIPMLLKLGLRVVAPDMMGYGKTDAPSDTLQDYGFKRAADDMKELAARLGESQIILCGHDWGAATAYRIAMYHPTLIRALITLAVPYFAPSPQYVPLALLAHSGRAPTAGYQLHLASGLIEEHISTSPIFLTRQFLLSCYGARTSSSSGRGRPAFIASRGIDLDALPDLQLSTTPLLDEAELSHYVHEYTRRLNSSSSGGGGGSSNPLHGPLNWYRTREVNYLDELQAGFVDPPSFEVIPASPPLSDTTTSVKPKVQITCPTLFIAAQRDLVFPMRADGQAVVPKAMREDVSNLTVRSLDASHWIAWERAEEVNALVAEWLTTRAGVEVDVESRGAVAAAPGGGPGSKL